MKKKTHYTLSFAEGMVEVRKPDAEQDSHTDGQQMFTQPQTSVIWLENYNPNLQLESIVIRTGYQVNDTSRGEVDVNEYIGKINVDFGSLYKYQDSVLLGATAFTVSEPAFCEGVVTFVHRIAPTDSNTYPTRENGASARQLRTAVVAYLPHYESSVPTIKWECNEIKPSGLRGYQNVPGYLTDFTIYGESILFTTLSPISDNNQNTNPAVSDETPRRRYPVYQYKFVNFTDYYRNDNALMLGLSEYDGATIEADKDKFARWIVKTPSGMILRSSVGAYTTIGNTAVKLNKDGSVGSGGIDDDIALIVWERDIQELEYEYHSEDFQVPYRQYYLYKIFGNPISDYVRAQLGVNACLSVSSSAVNLVNSVTKTTNPYVNLATTQTGKPSSYYNSLEALNLKTLYDLAKSKPTGYPLNYINRDAYIDDEDTNKITQGENVGANELGIVVQTFHANDKDLDIDYRTSRLNLYENQGVVDAPSGTTYTINNLAFPEYHSDHLSVGGPERPGDPKITEALYDYLALKIPRLWIPTEKIKFVVTGTINGIKVPLGEFDYIVRANNLNEYVGSIKAGYDISPGRYDPSFWTEADPLNPITIANLNNTKEMSSYSLYCLSKNAVGTIGSPTILDVKSAWFQMWASMVPSSINSSNGFLSKIQNEEPSVVNTDVLTINGTKIVYPLEHYTQRYLHSFNFTEINQGFSIEKQLPTPLVVLESGNGYYYEVFQTTRVGKIVSATIALKKSMIDSYIENGLTEISVYAIQPDTSDHIIGSIGLNSITEPDGIVYSKPKSITTKNDYTKFALIKTFSLVGKNQQIDDYKEIGTTRLTTNAWRDFGLNHCIAVPVKEGEKVPYDTVPPFDTVSTSELDDKDKTWTPDFYLWDYPTEQPLLLNYSGEVWDGGVGARCIAVVKGRTFIGGTYSEKGIEEQAIVRYSIAQGGVLSPDLFAKEDQLRIGHEPITALIEFREQLWVFNRTKNYRIQMRDIFDVTSWEFLEAVVQGVHHPKHLAQTPYGLVWCNEGGVWLSDGADPQSLSTPISGLYQVIARGESQAGTNIYFFNKDNKIMRTFVEGGVNGRPNEGNLGKNMNEYLECIYDAVNDEIAIYFPLFLQVEEGEDNFVNYDTRGAIIFSFKFRNWRTENIQIAEYDSEG